MVYYSSCFKLQTYLDRRINRNLRGRPINVMMTCVNNTLIPLNRFSLLDGKSYNNILRGLELIFLILFQFLEQLLLLNLHIFGHNNIIDKTNDFFREIINFAKKAVFFAKSLCPKLISRTNIFDKIEVIG